jgi:hypothetical protein
MAASSTLDAANRIAVNANGDITPRANFTMLKFVPQIRQTSSMAASAEAGGDGRAGGRAGGFFRSSLVFVTA